LNTGFKIFTILLGMFGAGIVTFYPLIGGLLICIYLGIEIQVNRKEKREIERKERFDFEVAKSLASKGAGNPYKAEIENELRAAGKIKDIIPKYEKVFAADNTDQDALAMILAGYAVLLNHQFMIGSEVHQPTLKSAQRYVRIALKKLKKQWHARSLINIAMIYDAAEEFKKSDRIYKRLIKDEPDNISVIDSYGLSCAMRGDALTAIDILETSVKNGKFTFLTLYNLAAAKHYLGHFSESNFYLTISYKLHDSWKTLLKISENNFLMGRFKEAFLLRVLCIIKGGLKQKGGVKNCLISLTCAVQFGFLLSMSFSLGKIPVLRRYYFKFIQPGQHFEELIRVQLEQFDDAFCHSAEFLEELLYIDPDNQILLYNLGIVYAKLGKKEKMLQCFDKLEKSDSVQQVIDKLAGLSEAQLKQQPIETRSGNVNDINPI